MRKKWVCGLCVGMALLMAGGSFAFAAETGGQQEKAAEAVTVPTDAYSEGRFVTKAIPYYVGSEQLNYHQETALIARYSDTKVPIPISGYYGSTAADSSQDKNQEKTETPSGYVLALIPAAASDRQVEAFFSSPAAFSDDNEDYGFYVGERMRGRGVISGSSGNRLEPEREITRAEAAAMIVRTLGLKNALVSETKASSATVPDPGYADVKSSAWYYEDVSIARQYGIVAAASEFAPNRLVSREEFLAMTQRGFALTGLLREVPEGGSGSRMAQVKDRDKIAAYARDVYTQLDYNNILQLDYEDDPSGALDGDGILNSVPYAYPKKAETRGEAIELLDQMIRQLPVCPSTLGVEWGFDKEMPVIDGSTSTHPFTRAVYSSFFYNPTQHPQYPEVHSKSYYSYQRLIDGEVDLIFASVYPANEIVDLAKSKGVELELIPVAYDAMVFYTNSSNSAVGLTSEQISKIYVENAYDNWNQIGGPDAGLIPYCRNNDSGSHAQMQRHFLNGNEINEAIRVENTARSMSDVLTEVIEAGHENPGSYALGYSIYYYYQNMTKYMLGTDELKLLAIDGILPTDQTIADGTYPLSNNTYVVLRKDEPKDSPARRMAEFMLTDEGQQCVQAAGFGPLKPVE